MNAKEKLRREKRKFCARITFAPHAIGVSSKKFIAKGIKCVSKASKNLEKNVFESQKPTCASAKIEQIGSWVVETMHLCVYSHCEHCEDCKPRKACNAPLPARLGIVGHVG